MDEINQSKKIRRVGKRDAIQSTPAPVPAPPTHTAPDSLAKPQKPSKAAKRAADVAVRHQAERERQTHAAKPRKKRGKSRAARILLYVLLGLLVVGGIIAGKFIYDINNPQNLFQPQPIPAPTPVPIATPSAVQNDIIAPTPTPTPDPEQALLGQADTSFMQNRVNILVLGLDESTERADWGAFRTDTMILLTINFDTKDVDMVSIPRDSYVKIANASGQPTDKFGKINSAFPAGGGVQKNGYGYAMGTVSYLLGGIPIQYYVGFNMNVVKEVVDAMGGVEYDVDIDVNMNGRKLIPGMQHLNGQGVLDYCRQRKGSSDIARVDRQQRMLTAIFRQLKNSGQIWHIPDIYKAVEQNIQTNLSFSQISALALIAGRMELDQLGRHTLDGEFLNLNNISYWGLRSSKVKSLVSDVFGVSIVFDEEMDASNVKAQVNASLALIAAELNDADTALKNAKHILSQYSDWLGDATRAQLNAYISQVEDAVDAGDKDELTRSTPHLAAYSNSILQKLQEAGAF